MKQVLREQSQRSEISRLSLHRPLQNQDSLYNPKQGLGQAQILRLKTLEGECKIVELKYLQANQVKALFCGVIMILSVVGLLFLKHYKYLRALLFYNRLQKEDKCQATHVYIKGTDDNEQICLIFSKNIHQRVAKVFQFKSLKYQILQNEEIPLALNYQQNLYFYISKEYAQSGLTYQQAKIRGQFYGHNEHKVEVPAYFQNLYDTMTSAFFIFQYIISAFYILQGAAMFGVLMIAVSWLTTSVNYILLRRSYNKIKETAQKEFPIRVLRSGEFSIIKNTELVPGDVYEPKEQIPCDSFIISGDMFVNEASLTGEDVPISKVKLAEASKLNQPCHWIFEGVTIQTTKANTLAVAIDIGFGSKKGRIIRKILTKSPKQPEFFRKLIYFLTEVLLIAIIIYFATLNYFLSVEVETIMVIFRFLDFVTSSFPAPFPLFFNLAYSCCLIRLNRDGIIGIQVQKTVQSARMKTICFDKTGTLTQNKMKLDKIFQILDSQKIVNITNQANNLPIVSGLFATCNSVQMINGEPKGDQIDLQMFLYTQGKFNPNIGERAIRTVLLQNQSYDILRINQYESRFQSMSVLVHSQNKYYIFAKGSPQMIHFNSQLKNRRFDSFVKELSLEGYRSIAFGYREVKKQEVEDILKQNRELFLRNITILGIVSFVNELKSDSCQTIELLSKNEINTKIITGDNIYLGIQTAIRTGMIPSNAKIVVLQGAKFDNGRIQLKTLSRNTEGGFSQETQNLINFQYKDEPNLFYAIDNDFIKMKENFLHSKIKVFARISPQNKALIVRKHKELYRKQIQSRQFFHKHFGQCGLKVGMVGDGANDLIAIKQADVGIGIAGADAVYSASFAIKGLFQIQQIIKQSKNTERQAIEIVQYFGLVQLTLLMQGIVLTSDASALSSLQYVYSYFLSSIIITNLLTVSRPAEDMCKYFNTSNFMGLEHHLVYWGNMVIFSAGMALSYLYYSNTSDFVPNPTPSITFQKGYARNTKSSTIVFLCQIVINVFLGVYIYRSGPWKEPFYKNKAFTIVVVVNFLLLIAMYFTTKYLSFMDVQPIGVSEAGVVLAIMMGSAAVSFVYNKILQKTLFHEKIYLQEQEQNYKKQQLRALGCAEIR